jgi:glycosyltransferase involved in cell wall biosynthesis
VRVAFINYVWDSDLGTPEAALERYFSLTDWSEAVQNAGATVVSVFQRFRTDATLRRNGIEYRFVAEDGPPSPSMWTGGAPALHKAVASAGADLVHVNGVFHPRRVRHLRSIVPAAAALIVQDHGGFEPQAASRLKRAWLRRGLSAADALMVSSSGQIDHWRTSGIVPGRVMTFDVMESSTSMQRIDRADAQALSGVIGAPALLWVGRLNENKDPLTVLRGLINFFEALPAAGLTMVFASGDLEPRVRALIAASPALTGRVRLAGRVSRSEMPTYFSAADLFVLGSHREGSGYAAIEALALGVLPVLTDIPSFRALTDNGRVGELWQAGSAESFRRAVERAAARLGDDERGGCRRWFEQSFSWAAIGQRAVMAYRSVIEARRRASSDKRRLAD